MDKERLKTFNDAVVAIIITLMVLDIKLPAMTADGLADLLRHLFAYAISFFTIAIGWVNLQLLFDKCRQLTARIIWLDLVLLFFLSLLPLPTLAIGEHFSDPASHVFFGLVQLLVSLVFKVLIHAIERDAHAAKVHKSARGKRLDTITIVVYTASMGLCYVSVYLSTLLFLIPPVIYFPAAWRRQVW